MNRIGVLMNRIGVRRTEFLAESGQNTLFSDVDFYRLCSLTPVLYMTLFSIDSIL